MALYGQGIWIFMNTNMTHWRPMLSQLMGIYEQKLQFIGFHPIPATKNPISAYKRVMTPTVLMLLHGLQKKERLLGSPYADPVKIVSQAYDRDAQSISPADDITPTFDEDGNSSNGIKTNLIIHLYHVLKLTMMTQKVFGFHLQVIRREVTVKS